MSIARLGDALRTLLPSVSIPTENLWKLRGELVAGRVVRGQYAGPNNTGCILFWLVGCRSRLERYAAFMNDPNRIPVTSASETVITVWDSGATASEAEKSAMTTRVIKEIDREIRRRKRLAILEERVRRKALAPRPTEALVN
jgi:hypothetical protein